MSHILEGLDQSPPSVKSVESEAYSVTNKFWYISMDWDHYYTHWESFKMGSAILGPLRLVTVCLRIQLID